jgi:ABC-type phosphate transport system substrate-binding protein
MKMPLIAKTSLLLFFLQIIIASLCLANNAPLGGPAFSAPDHITETPAGWAEKPLKFSQDKSSYDLVITLDQQLYAALLPLIQTYAREHNLNVSVGNGTCGISYGQLEKKAVDISGFCCPPGPTDRLPGVEYHTLGIAALAILINPDNRLLNLSIDQARSIFMGEINRWSELMDENGLPLPDQVIEPVTRLHCKLRAGHWRLLLSEESLFSQTAVSVGTIKDMLKVIEDNPQTIGYEVLWSLEHHKSNNLKAIQINGFSPFDPQSLIKKQYPFYRTYNLTTWTNKENKKPAAEALVLNLLKQIGTIDQKHGIIPAAKLRSANWQFRKNELIGEPPGP